MDKRTYSKNPLFMLLGLVTIVAILIGGFTVTPGYGQAQSNTEQFKTTFESTGTPLCGGENIFFSITMHSVFHETIGPDGESIYTFSHSNFQKARGVSESGEIFVITDVVNSRSHTYSDWSKRI